MVTTADGTVRLDFNGRRLRFERPVRVIVARAVAEVVPALEDVARAAANGLHAAGFVGYEAAPAFDAALRVRAGGALPLLWFGLYDAGCVREDRNAYAEDGGAAEEVVLPTLVADTSAADHASAVAAIREAIAAGDVYQVNYTVRFASPMSAVPLTLESAWRRGQGTGYFAALRTGSQHVVSLSPELFFSVRGRTITTRPMKGTARRGRWAAEDDAAAARLAASEKDRAENLMIVDLMRNDLGRVARFGSVRVPRLFEIERYPTVHQMTSTITAELREGVGLVDVFRALFPCGSVTGAPKVAAMASIAELERSPRGVYCGAIGHVEPGGDCTFNVAIRTLVADAVTKTIVYGAGGGITWDSNAAAEYDEVHAKVQVIRRPWRRFALLETMLLEDGSYPLRPAHLARLSASAAYFGWAANGADVDAALDACARRAGRWRVRLLLHEDGEVDVDATPLSEAAPAALRVTLVADAVHSGDVFLYHKTTRRGVYDAARKGVGGADDALLCNERGELTELTVGNLVMELDGGLFTPPRSSGLLPGVLRESLLRAGRVGERPLRPAELARAQRCWRVNAVRGWQPITRVEDAAGRALFCAPAGGSAAALPR